MYFVFLLHILSRELYCESRMGGRALSLQAPLLRNQLPVWMQSTDVISTFEIRLQTFLFDKLVSATNHSFILLSNLIRCTE